MSASTPSMFNDLSEAFSLVNSMSAVLNPYPLILQAIASQKAKIANPSLPKVVFVLGVVHLVLLLLAAITFFLKASRKDNGKRRKIWFWRTHYVANQTIPYLVPNGNFSIELLQIFSCSFYIIFSVTTYAVCTYPQVPSDITHASIIFWYAIAIVPDAAAFWWGGWAAIYLVYLSPTQLDITDSNTKKSFIRHPIFMNTLCIGVPAVVATYFLIVGITMAVELKQILNSYNLLGTTLHELSVLWKPDDPLNHEKNRTLFNLFETILGQVSRVTAVAQRETYGWAAVSISMIAFYLATTISAGHLLKRTLSIATGKKSLCEKRIDPDKSVNYLDESISSIDSKAGSEGFKLTFVKCTSTLRLQRGYYFIYISCAIMLAVLGLNICISVIFGLKTKVILIQTDWQIRLLTMISSTSALLSFSLFLQSLMLLVWG
ncbi:uncharacterized protein PGTG_01853 [Puccinia graminis f. sp. tritici CRL 75-36-700-3]|uniref:Uncharacterized protein n=2 Tax=Puccinia graminis f. sp. tritici TaxID=56615 RepID=E3JT33_PUCGT|nr:uncharacterized protein PGTG_01853 [Puccinia graminis f. sp. tritici CRL 75-36-700-3]EFP75260.1 hypothetical protein PGTG_01853 [Puccinia graminis f. sp. tritici CRL 75-36-700-3]